MRDLLIQESARRRGESRAELSLVDYGLPAHATSDSSWLLVEEGFSPARENELESIFTTANGFIGTRASLAEGSSFSSPLTLISGVFGIPPKQDAVPELVPVPDWTHFSITVRGQQLSLERPGTVDHRRTFDMKQGIMWRHWRYCDPAGRITQVCFIRLASLANRHAVLQLVAITPENYGGDLCLESRLRHPAPDAGIVLVSEPALVASRRSSIADILVAEFRARESGTVLAFASANQLYSPQQDDRWVPEFRNSQDTAVLRWDVRVEAGRTYRFDRLVYATTSREVAAPAEIAPQRVGQILAHSGVEKVISTHTAAWAERWQSAEVQLEGDHDAQCALRFAAYHLISAANPDDEHASVGARGLTGRSYHGHVFWDTEIFLLPFYIFTHPATARSLLMYRCHTLPAAREKARACGYRGALFAWESTDDGREATPGTILGAEGKMIRVLTGEQEQHISADVAYAVWHYWQASGDDQFLFSGGAEVLLETARFWVSRARRGTDRLYHIAGVIGPDEYHEGVDDNAYTNVMAQWNLERGAEIARLMEERWPERWRELQERVQLDFAEPEQWRETAHNMYTGLDPRTGLYEQFRGYFDLDPIDLASYEPRRSSMEALLGRERLQRSHVIKQADVVMLLALLWDRFAPEVREANFRYYAPRTDHGSSLSPAIHALVAARLGDVTRARQYFQQAALIDLADEMGNSAGGVHIAALGGLWQAVVFGFMGMKVGPDGLSFDPHIPEKWQRLNFLLRWHDQEFRVTFDGKTRSATVSHGN